MVDGSRGDLRHQRYWITVRDSTATMQITCLYLDCGLAATFASKQVEHQVES